MIINLKLLIVEDNQEDFGLFEGSSERYEDEKKVKLELVQCKNLRELDKIIDNTFDGAIIDLKLANVDAAGNEAANKILLSCFRIPVVIFTGTPSSVDNKIANIIETYRKGDVEHQELFDVFLDIYNTGITKIMGGRGVIEQALSEVFIKNILPQKNTWIEYGRQDSDRTEKALLRYTLSHLLELLEQDNETCFPEELYIYPNESKYISTGSIIERKKDQCKFVVLTPACDLVVRKEGDFKATKILLAEINDLMQVADQKKKGITKKNKQRDAIEKLLKNSSEPYYHTLPKTSFFPGGIINFREPETISKTDMDNKFLKTPVQIAPLFIKDIVSRFSSFYARQGQPDLDLDNLIEELINS